MKLVKDEKFHDKGYHNFEGNLDQPRHRWYPFKEGFSAELVEEALASKEQGRPLRVLDPFGGSGTTAVTAAMSGHEAHSIEVNPFCAFTSRVKCTGGAWRKKSFDRVCQQVHKKALRYRSKSPLENLSTFSEQSGRPKWLFNSSVLRAFHAVSRAVDDTPSTYSDALRLASIRAAMECCNAKKDGKALRYRKGWESRGFCADDFREHFERFSSQVFEDISLAPIEKSNCVRTDTGDARAKLSSLRSNSFDQLVTSPPYLNSFDYSDVYRPELFLGGFVGSNNELREIRLKTLRSHIQVKWGGSIEVESPLLAQPLERLKASPNLWNQRIPQMVSAYFHDMRKIMVEGFRVLRPESEAWFVVSTSAYAGVEIPVDLILAELGCSVGFELNGVYALRSLRAAGQQQSKFSAKGFPLRESLIILNKR